MQVSCTWKQLRKKIHKSQDKQENFKQNINLNCLMFKFFKILVLLHLMNDDTIKRIRIEKFLVKILEMIQYFSSFFLSCSAVLSRASSIAWSQNVMRISTSFSTPSTTIWWNWRASSQGMSWTRNGHLLPSFCKRWVKHQDKVSVLLTSQLWSDSKSHVNSAVRFSTQINLREIHSRWCFSFPMDIFFSDLSIVERSLYEEPYSFLCEIHHSR